MTRQPSSCPVTTTTPRSQRKLLLLLQAAATAALLILLMPSIVEAAKPFCGDGKCTGGESADTCPTDCMPVGYCGDGVCDGDESCDLCPEDCGSCPPASCDNNGICNSGEDCLSCPGDCPGVTGGKPSGRYCCGLDTCDVALCGDSCGSPSTTECGNGIIESGEQCDDGNITSGDGCSELCAIEPTSTAVPTNQFNAGDSIGEGEAADGTIGEAHHETVWSTGYASGDYVQSLNERFEASDAGAYFENDSGRDATFNHALSGAEMGDFAQQAQAIVSATADTPNQQAGMVSLLLGNNDVCATSLEAMTSPGQFESDYRAGLDVLANNDVTAQAEIHVSSIPAIYWLWEAKRGDFWCRIFAWPFVPCENLLDNPADDCASDASRLDPDVIYAGDGPNCQRRKEFHARIRDVYNPILRDVLAEYRENGRLPNAYYVDVFDVRFGSSHVNGGDCFHPSEAGHALLGEAQWCRTKWSDGDPLCTP